MQNLTVENLPAVPHVVFGVFNLAVPDLLFWIAVIVVFFVGCWARMPKFMEHGSSAPDRRADE